MRTPVVANTFFWLLVSLLLLNTVLSASAILAVDDPVPRYLSLNSAKGSESVASLPDGRPPNSEPG